MIPRLIHQLWIPPTGPIRETKSLPDDVELNCIEWQTLNPQFEYRRWSLETILSLTRLYDRPDVSAALEVCRFPSMQADIARLFLLEFAGGFWVDLKLFPEQSFLNGLAESDLITVEHFPKENLNNPNGFLSNSFIGAKACHPAISRALDLAVRNVRSRMPGSIFYVTGSPVLIEATRDVADLGKYEMLRHEDAWGKLFTIRGGSYNASGMHWSEREKVEPSYIERRSPHAQSSPNSVRQPIYPLHHAPQEHCAACSCERLL